MANTARKVATALAASATLLTASLATAAGAERRAIVLHVNNFAALSPAHLARAGREVTRIYNAAGAQTIWVEDNDPGAGADGALHVKVYILDQAMSERKIAADHVTEGVLGQAAKVTGRAYILTHRIMRVAANYRVDAATLLGRVIAHEVGHLILPERSHAATGIMCAKLNPRASDGDRFTLDQIAMIHRVLAPN